MALTCTDMIRAEDYFEANQKPGNASITSESMAGDELLKY